MIDRFGEETWDKLRWASITLNWLFCTYEIVLMSVKLPYKITLRKILIWWDFCRDAARVQDTFMTYEVYTDNITMQLVTEACKMLGKALSLLKTWSDFLSVQYLLEVHWLLFIVVDVQFCLFIQRPWAKCGAGAVWRIFFWVLQKVRIWSYAAHPWRKSVWFYGESGRAARLSLSFLQGRVSRTLVFS